MTVSRPKAEVKGVSGWIYFAELVFSVCFFCYMRLYQALMCIIYNNNTLAMLNLDVCTTKPVNTML